MKELFESWVKVQFDGIFNHKLLDFDNSGYSDPAINAMWVGFCAGFTLRDNQS